MVMVEDGEAADQLADGLDGWRDVDHGRVLGDEAVVAVALCLQDERLLLAVNRTEIWKKYINLWHLESLAGFKKLRLLAIIVAEYKS